MNLVEMCRINWTLRYEKTEARVGEGQANTELSSLPWSPLHGLTLGGTGSEIFLPLLMLSLCYIIDASSEHL